MSTTPSYVLQDGRLQHGATVLIEGVDPRLGFHLGQGPGQEPELDCGVVLRYRAEPRATHRIPLGRIPHLTVSTCLHRTSPFWMVPQAGTPGTPVPIECQWMLAELADGSCLMLAPLIDGARRWTLESEQGRIALAGSANDPQVIEEDGAALFLAHGQDPYQLMPRAASALARRMGWRVRTQRLHPATPEGLGWCTFNAYYAEISHERIRTALQSRAHAGIPLRWLLIDGGWQPSRRAAGQEELLSAIPADPLKFPHGLAETISMAKGEFQLQAVMVWHALIGLPAGIQDGAVPGLAAELRDRHHPPSIYAVQPTIDEWFGPRVSTPRAKDAGTLFAALHRYLRAAGADAVKVDFQSTLESICRGEGGRVAVDRAWRSALEASCLEHFAGSLINCMSCSSECLYLGSGSAWVRTSDDYYPNRPEAHGLHLHVNAQMGMWFGEFVQPDWDMFQSGHPYGAYHAAGRALSGGPLLITDEVGRHDAGVIARLVLPDGRGLPVDGPARPCPESLYRDPTRERIALKVFTRCGAAGVVGLFHANHQERLPIEASVGAQDVPGMAQDDVIVHLHHAGSTKRLGRGRTISLSLAHAGHEVAVLAPVQHGFAVLGLIELYCAPPASISIDCSKGELRLLCIGGGTCCIWSERTVRQLQVDGVDAPWRRDEASGIVSCALAAGSHQLVLRL